MILTPEQARARQTASPFKSPIRPAQQPICDQSTPAEDSTILIVEDHSPGRPAGAPNMPIETKALIGTIANLPGSQKELAAQLDISQQQLSNIKHGKVNGQVHDELKANLDAKISKVNDVAIDKLMSAMNLITDDKLNVASARVLSGVAKDMSAIVNTMNGKDKPTGQNVIILHAPGMHRESFYDVIEVES